MSDQIEMGDMHRSAGTSAIAQDAGAVSGYPKMADLVGRNPELLMVRRFRALNARNILYLQAELQIIEEELLRLESIDARSENPEKMMYSKDYWSLMESAKQEGHEQWVLIQKMKEKLKDYNDALIQQTVLSRAPNPSRFDRRLFQTWLERPSMGDSALVGADHDIWSQDSKHLDDLVAINGNNERVDSVTTWFLGALTQIFHRLAKPKPNQDGLVYYDGTGLESFVYPFVSLVTTVVSSLFLVICIIILYFVPTNSARLGVVAAFTALLSLGLALITPDQRKDNFAATAAFAAVQVVFIGTSGNSTSGG